MDINEQDIRNSTEALVESRMTTRELIDAINKAWETLLDVSRYIPLEEPKPVSQEDLIQKLTDRVQALEFSVRGLMAGHTPSPHMSAYCNECGILYPCPWVYDGGGDDGL